MSFTKILKCIFLFNFFFLLFLSFFAEFFANEKPIFVIYKKKAFFPIFFEYTYDDFFLNNSSIVKNVNKINKNEIYKNSGSEAIDYSNELFLKIKPSAFVIFPPVKFSFDSIDKSLIPPTGVSKTHPLGTTPFGIDFFAIILYSVRDIIFFASTVSFLTLLISLILGIISGYFGGVFDFVLGRILELLMSINLRFLFLILGIIGELKTSTLIIIWAFFKISYPTRVIRKKTNVMRESFFVKSATMIGMSHKEIIIKKILRNVIRELLILFPFILKNVIISVASLFWLTPSSSNQFLIGELINMTKQYFSLRMTLGTFGALLTIILGLVFSVEILEEKFKFKK